MKYKVRLALGAASTAIAIGATGPAHAACTVDGSTVTCTADSTAAEVNAALASVTESGVTLEIADAANVIQPNDQIQPSQQGAVAIGNGGDVGTSGAPVGLFYVGTSASAANTFSFDNSGSITGEVAVLSVGGATDITNSGLLAEGVFVNVQGISLRELRPTSFSTAMWGRQRPRPTIPTFATPTRNRNFSPPFHPPWKPRPWTALPRRPPPLASRG